MNRADTVVVPASAISSNTFRVPAGSSTGFSGRSAASTTSKPSGTSRARNHSPAVVTGIPNGHHPSARVSARRSDRCVRPPIQNGRCSCSAQGSTVNPLNE
jgi:hypothetical protein